MKFGASHLPSVGLSALVCVMGQERGRGVGVGDFYQLWSSGRLHLFGV